MEIGVISDTHLSKPTPELYELQHTVFADAAVIIHAGDLTELQVLEAFSGKEVVAVSGNMDSRAVQQKLPAKTVLELGGFRIGIIHGWGHPFGIPAKIAGTFGDVDVIVYGHSHRPDNEIRSGVLFFNPGAFSGGFPWITKRSVGILTLGERAAGRIIHL